MALKNKIKVITMLKKVSIELTILLFINLSIIAQDNQDKRTDISPYCLQYSMLDFNMRALTPHGYLTQFTYFDMNFVNSRLQDYLSNKLDLVRIGEPVMDMSKPEKSISLKYEPKVQYNFAKPRNITVKYNLFDNNGLLVIKSCTISGYWDYITNLFVSYWITNLNFEAAKKGEVVVCYLLQDRIALSLKAGQEYGKISITNTTIDNPVQFQQIIEKNNQSNLGDDISAYKLKKQKEIEEEKKQKENEEQRYANEVNSFKSQSFYVNTDNLILRDSPEKEYSCVLILHAPAKLKTVYFDPADYKNNPSVLNKFVLVEFVFSDNYSFLNGSEVGWVMKKYIVAKKSLITKYDTIPPTFGGAKEYHDGNMYDEVPKISYAGSGQNDPNRAISRRYIYPKYKGGNEPIASPNTIKSSQQVKAKK